MCGKENHVGEIGSDGEGSVYKLHADTKAGAREKVSFEPYLKMRVRPKNLWGKCFRQRETGPVPTLQAGASCHI